MMHLQHREERAMARAIARAKYPYTRIVHSWGEGTAMEHEISTFSDHPQYEKEYLRQLKIVRANRKAKNTTSV